MGGTLHPGPGAARRRRLAACVAVAFCALATAPAMAGRLVLFRDMRTLVAETVEYHGPDLVVRLGGGNEIVVPADTVAEVRDYVPPPEPPATEVATAGVGGPVGPRWQDRAGRWAASVEATARKAGVDPALLVAVALTESRLDAFALSPKGAQGMMQLMPGTARRLRIGDVWDAHQNLEGGARWLRRLLDRFDGDVDLALAAYNAGEEAVKRYNGVPPFPETRDYVRRIRGLFDGFAAAQAAAGT